jgi:hypothetical protein
MQRTHTQPTHKHTHTHTRIKTQVSTLQCAARLLKRSFLCCYWLPVLAFLCGRSKGVLAEGELHAVFQDARWTRAVFFRDPLDRFLAAWKVLLETRARSSIGVGARFCLDG